MTTYTAIPDADIDTDSPLTQSLMTLLRDNPLGIQEGASGAPRIVRGAIAAGVGHRWFFDYGDGSDTAITHSASTTIPPGLYQCTTFQIDATYTVGLSAKGPLIICATTSITINGTLDVDGDGATGGNATFNGSDGVFGGSAGSASSSEDGGAVFNVNGGTGSGSNGASQSARDVLTLLSLMPIFNIDSGSVYGGRAIAGGGGGGGGTTSTGGHGGGLVVLCAPTVTVGAAGVITADGQAGSNGFAGAGGGGAIIIATPSGGYTNSGSVAAAGGTSGGSGGDGGAGWVKEVVLT